MTETFEKIKQKETSDRIFEQDQMNDIDCEYKNGNSEISNGVRDLGLEDQFCLFQEIPYEFDNSGAFYRYDPDQCILCGRCVEVCQDVQVNETLLFDWDRQEPRVLWDGGESID